MGQSRLRLFLTFLIPMSITISTIQIKKAWDSNQGLHNGKRRRNRGAMADAHIEYNKLGQIVRWYCTN